MGGFASEASPPSPLVASDSEDEDDDDGDGDDDVAFDDDDGDASSTDEMSTCHSYPLSLMTKRGSSFGYMRVVILRGRVSIVLIFVRGSVDFLGM